jgi:hypothetical protein
MTWLTHALWSALTFTIAAILAACWLLARLLRLLFGCVERWSEAGWYLALKLGGW